MQKKLFSICLFLNFYMCNAVQENTQSYLVEHVVKSIKNAEMKVSKLNEDILNLQGMSSDKVRHFLNNICSLPGGKYLEVGVWQGSTFVSALYQNTNLLDAIAIDNWSEFGGPKHEFQHNLSTFLSDINFSFFETDCFNFDLSNIRNKINIYFYDGGHTYQDQKRALTYYNTSFEDTFIVIIDDYNWLEVQLGTQAAFKELGYKVIYEQYLSSERNPLPDQRETAGWWNGIYVAVVSKY